MPPLTAFLVRKPERDTPDAYCRNRAASDVLTLANSFFGRSLASPPKNKRPVWQARRAAGGETVGGRLAERRRRICQLTAV